ERKVGLGIGIAAENEEGVRQRDRGLDAPATAVVEVTIEDIVTRFVDVQVHVVDFKVAVAQPLRGHAADRESQETGCQHCARGDLIEAFHYFLHFFGFTSSAWSPPVTGCASPRP